MTRKPQKPRRMSVKSHPLWGFVRALGDRQFMPTAVRVAAVVGTLLFAINHGSAVMRGKMTRDRWISSILTYLVPYPDSSPYSSQS